jgi:hypothetical protein
MPTKSKQKEFKTPKQMYQAHKLLWNQIIQILKDHSKTNSTNPKYFKGSFLDILQIKSQAFKDLNFKYVRNHCFGCEWSIRVWKSPAGEFSCSNCLFDRDPDRSCLNDLWGKLNDYYNSWLGLYSYIYPKKSLNQVIKVAEHIRDFPINPKLSK